MEGGSCVEGDVNDIVCTQSGDPSHLGSAILHNTENQPLYYVYNFIYITTHRHTTKGGVIKYQSPITFTINLQSWRRVLQWEKCLLYHYM